MAERKAVNKYYPPDWDPRKGSVNKRVGQHPLRDRARKLSQGILVIRFELPYNIWCGGCGSHVGMGVRYNAEKSKVGNYYSTPIYKFRMKCHLCDNYFEIQTDPKNHDYVILEGARRKEQRWDPVANEQIVPEDKNVHKKMTMDAMFKLEHGTDDKVKGKEKVKNLAELEASRFSMKEDYILNRMARDKFRAEKKELKELAEADKSILDRGALSITLVEETEEDRSLAGLMKYSVTSSYEEKQKVKRKSIEQRPLFDTVTQVATPTPSLSSSSSSSSSSTRINNSENTKSKLTESLRLSRKDPFAIIKSGKSLCSSRSEPSILGIRLKNSKPSKSKASKSFIRKSLRTHLRNNSDICVRNNLKSNNCTSTERLPSMQSNTCDSKTSISNSAILHNTDSCCQESRGLPLDTSCVNYPKIDTNINTQEKDEERQVLTSMDSSVMNKVDEQDADISNSSISTSVGNETHSGNASGLSMLISSYDEGNDSDSWSSS